MVDEIKKLKEAEQQRANEEHQPAPRVSPNGLRPVRRKRSQSLFGPILLIAIGSYFLLRNLGFAGLDANLWLIGRLWPLLLVFAGANIIVRQLPRPWGTALSGLLGVAAVGLFTLLLIFGHRLPIIGQFTAAAEIKTETIAIELADAETADVTIDFSSIPANISALEDSGNIVAGTADYVGEFSSQAEIDGRHTIVHLSASSGGLFPYPFEGYGNSRWELGLTPRIPLNLRLDMSSAPAKLDLAALHLSNLRIDGASGPLELHLPDGDYDLELDIGSGPVKVYLPAGGRHTFTVDGGSGPVTFFLPSGMEARANVKDGSGPFRASARFSLISGLQDDDGVWETERYRENAANQINLLVDIGSGPITISDN